MLLSPGASHSGYEDHFQSDAFHYLHHRYFECNYAGADAAFLDLAFGTYRGALADNDSADAREDAKSSLRTIPPRAFVAYLGGSVALCAIWHYSANLGISPLLASSLVGFGPVALAMISPSWVKRTQMSIWANVLHIVMGALFCSIPITYMCWLVIA